MPTKTVIILALILSSCVATDDTPTLTEASSTLEDDRPFTRLDAAYGLAEARCVVHSCFTTVEALVRYWCPSQAACAGFTLIGVMLEGYEWCFGSTITNGVIPPACTGQLFPDAGP